MRKKIYLIKGIPQEDYTSFSRRVISRAKLVSSKDGINSVKLSYTLAPPPVMSVIPFKKEKIGALSVTHNNIGLINEIVNEPGFTGAYEVEEALPVTYSRNWPDHEHTPGVCLLTLFSQKKDIDYDTFIDRWHNSHTPLSLRYHPLWNYNRNVVQKHLSGNDHPWDGIVEEQFRERSHLLNPVKFFGNPLVILYRMLMVYTDTRRFLDYKTIEPYLATELHIKS